MRKKDVWSDKEGQKRHYWPRWDWRKTGGKWGGHNTRTWAPAKQRFKIRVPET